jgi:hypothetical protein
MKVKFTSTSVNDKVQTLSTSQFDGREFSYGERYRVYFSNGTSAIAYVNRQSAASLAIANEDLPKGLRLAKVGSPVFRAIKSLKKIK